MTCYFFCNSNIVHCACLNESWFLNNFKNIFFKNRMKADMKFCLISSNSYSLTTTDQWTSCELKIKSFKKKKKMCLRFFNLCESIQALTIELVFVFVYVCCWCCYFTHTTFRPNFYLMKQSWSCESTFIKISLFFKSSSK